MTTPYLTPPEFSWPAAPGGKLHTYLAGGTTPQVTYSDAAGATPNTNPVTLDSLGSAVVRLAVGVAYHFTLKDPTDVTTIWDADNYDNNYLSSVTITGAIVGAVLFPQTAGELAAGITPSNFTYPPGNVLRYGLIANSSGAGAANLTALKALWNPTTGIPGRYVFPNLGGSDIYYIGAAGATCVIPIRPGVYIDLQNSTLNFNGTGTSADSNSGCFFATQDFELKNGTINVTWATGPSTSSGYAVQLGGRGADSSYFTIWDSLLATPMGRIRLSNLRINSTVTGANVSSSGFISVIGGVNNVWMDNLIMAGSGTGGVQQGITYEFGWATSNAVASTRQTSHAHNWHLTNIQISNMDNVAALSTGIVLTGAYGIFIDGYQFSGVSQGLLIAPGEAMFYRPWAGVDDTGAKHNITLRNIVGTGFSQVGLIIDGTVSRAANSGYLQPAWTINTAYIVGQTVINGGNMYVCTVGGTSAGAGGPSGTGSGIIDNTVTWNYVTLNANTDLYDVSLDGFALTALTGGGQYGVWIKTSRADVRNGTIIGSSTGLARGIVVTDECVNFEISGVRIFNVQQQGIQLDIGFAVWSPPRNKRGTIRNCYIAGASSSAAGANFAITIAQCDNVTIEECRFGYETVYSSFNELTQAGAVFSGQMSSTFNVLFKNNRVAGAVGGVALQTVGGAAIATNGNTIENCTFNAGGTNPVTTPAVGAWLSDLEFNYGALANGNTIPASGSLWFRTVRVAPAAAVTTIKLIAGGYQGQTLTVINESSAANSVTFDVQANSKVADGASCVIAGLTQKTFVWNTGATLWFHS